MYPSSIKSVPKRHSDLSQPICQQFYEIPLITPHNLCHQHVIYIARHLRVGVTKLEVIPGYKITRKQESSFTQSFTQIYSFIQVIQV